MVDVRVTDGPETREEEEGEGGWKREIRGDLMERKEEEVERAKKKKEDKGKTKHGRDLE